MVHIARALKHYLLFRHFPLNCNKTMFEIYKCFHASCFIICIFLYKLDLPSKRGSQSIQSVFMQLPTVATFAGHLTTVVQVCIATTSVRQCRTVIVCQTVVLLGCHSCNRQPIRMLRLKSD